jgi:hypothetical protein
MKTKRKLVLSASSGLFALVLSGLFMTSCKKSDSPDRPSVRDVSINMSAKQEVPPVKNRNETGSAHIVLFPDSTLAFSFSVSGLASGDQLTVAHIHTGGPVESGSPVIVLVDNSTIKFNGTNASGTIKLTSSQYRDYTGSGDFYVNVHSSQLPDGVLRGQIGKTFSLVMNVDLTPLANPGRPETGTALLRVSSDSTLYYKVIVSNLLMGDVLTSASINSGAAGGSGAVLLSLYSQASDFGKAKSVKLSASQMNSVMNSQLYINVQSTQLPVELLRGQIR